MSEQKLNNDWEPVSVTLPARYWIPVLAMVNHHVRTHSVEQVKELNAKGAKVEDVPDAERTVIVGPMVAQGEIITALNKAGIINDKTNATLGIEAFMKQFVKA